MAEYFEISLIYNCKIDMIKCFDIFNIFLGNYSYSGNLEFFNNKEILFNEYNNDSTYIYEFSIPHQSLFNRENVLKKIENLTQTIDEFYLIFPFNFGVASIEFNSILLGENKDLLPNNDIILNSPFIFIPKNILSDININLRHFIFEGSQIVCLFNPMVILLFTSESEKYNILQSTIY